MAADAADREWGARICFSNPFMAADAADRTLPSRMIRRKWFMAADAADRHGPPTARFMAADAADRGRTCVSQCADGSWPQMRLTGCRVSNGLFMAADAADRLSRFERAVLGRRCG